MGAIETLARNLLQDLESAKAYADQALAEFLAAGGEIAAPAAQATETAVEEAPSLLEQIGAVIEDLFGSL